MQAPPLGFHFLVVFFVGGIVPNPLDVRFRRVSGLGASMTPQNVEAGGQNLFSYRLPTRFSYQNLVLERGLFVGSPLEIEFQTAMSLFRFNAGTTLVMLLNEKSIPASAWLFFNTYPVSWSTSDLNADENSVVIDTMELAYTRYQRLTLDAPVIQEGASSFFNEFFTSIT